MASAGGVQRLRFLDGLRGLACAYVLLFHAATIHVGGAGELGPAMRMLLAWLSQGRLSVVFFIVLSGYSLMLPVSRSGELRGGFVHYIRRRARRIFPPYYAALVLSIAMIAFHNAFGARLGLGSPIDPAALGAGSVFSHVFLVHNLVFDWAFRINGPMWSVATEWQIYFVFALLLLPLWRLAGPAVGVVTAWVTGSLPFFLLPPSENFFWACPWFIGSFAFGMWGADLYFSPRYEKSWWRERAPWGLLALSTFAGLVLLFWSELGPRLPYPVLDFLVSAFAIFSINSCVQNVTASDRKPSLLLRLLESPWLVALGGFSYSLYLIQHPLIRLTEKLANRLPLGHDAMLLSHLLLATPIAVLVAWLFAELFEKPFTTGGVLIPALRSRFARGTAGTPSARG